MGKNNIDLLNDLPLKLEFQIGSQILSVKDVVNLTKGSIIELDREISSNVDVLVDGQIIGKGEVVVLQDRLCIRMLSLGN